MTAVPLVDPLDCLEAELAWLDRILERAVARQRNEGRWRGADDLRGVYTPPAVAAAVLAGRTVAAPDAGEAPPRSTGDTPLWRVWERFALDDFERFALLLALAPEVDARYRTVFGFLHDEVAQRSPTVALALDLFTGSGLRSARLRRAFRPNAPLVRYRLVRLRPAAGSSSLLQHGLEVDDWVVARVLADAEPDTDLERPPGAEEVARIGLRSVPLVVVSTDRRAAVDRALELVGPCVVVDRRPAEDPEEALRVAARHAKLDGLGVVVSARQLGAVADLATAFAADRVPIVVVADPRGSEPLPDDWEHVTLPDLVTTQRRARWEARLAAADIPVADGALDVVAASYAISLEGIDAAVARLATDGRRLRTAPDLQTAARSVARHRLGTLARRVAAGRTWDELVLPTRTIEQLHEISAAIAKRPQVLEAWGFGAAPGGRGMHVLFSGPSGTGKTLAASVIADEAGYALYAVDLATVVDKYLGETEKQLDRVFDEASEAGAVLLFDEADALFGQRAEVHDARDRYANLEVAYLLQRLEGHEGVTILATNLPNHLDQAFARRLHHRVEFPIPDAALRRRLWTVSLPDAAPLAADLDLELVAERFELAGGSIRNAALTAAYLAADDGGAIGMAHVVRAVARELEKAGRPATRAEFRELHPLLAADVPLS